MSITGEETTYRLGKKSSFWMAFTPSSHVGSPTWQMQVTARSRSGKILALLLETTALKPIATVTVKGEAYPLTIGWHESRRGGLLRFGGERKIGTEGGMISWEMIWLPIAGEEGAYRIEMRARATPRREGHFALRLSVPLHQPELWHMRPATERGHCAAVARSGFNCHSVGFVMLDAPAGEAEWDDAQGAFCAVLRSFPLGGTKKIQFSLRFISAGKTEEARAALVMQYAAIAGTHLHPMDVVAPLDSRAAIRRLTQEGAYDVKGTERIYLKPPAPEEKNVHCAGFPHYPLDALKALWDWQRLHPSELITRLVRYGARGIAVDFQVMGRGDEAEPNKGAFWDRKSGDIATDWAGGATHGLASNARLARAFFLLHEATGEALFRQSALNICQWLILKQNEAGYYDGERVHATRGLADDGRFLPQPCTLDGVEAIWPFMLAFRATANEVFVKAAWKIANHLIEHRLRDFDSLSPTSAAAVVSGLLALDAEAPNARLRRAVREWGTWLRILPLRTGSCVLNADGLHGGLFECAEAGFGLYALDADPTWLRYAFHALSRVPPEAHARSWRTPAIQPKALIALTGLLPGARMDFDALNVTLGWRTFAPDPATDEFLRVTAPDSSPVDFLPLVCRLNDQLLVIALAPPATEAISILKNGRHPLVRDLLTDTLDSVANLHPLLGEDWARVGLFTIDP